MKKIQGNIHWYMDVGRLIIELIEKRTIEDSFLVEIPISCWDENFIEEWINENLLKRHSMDWETFLTKMFETQEKNKPYDFIFSPRDNNPYDWIVVKAWTVV